MNRTSSCYSAGADIPGDGHGSWVTQGPPASFSGDSYLPLLCGDKSAGAVVRYDYEEEEEDASA